MSKLQLVAMLVACLLFAAGLWIIVWATTDGTYTGLFAVEKVLTRSDRTFMALLGFVLCLPLLLGGLAVRAINNSQHSRRGVDAEPKQKNVALTPWEQELIDKARRKRDD